MPYVYAGLNYAQLYEFARGHTAVSPARQLGQPVYVQQPLPPSVLGGMGYAGMPTVSHSMNLHVVSNCAFNYTYSQPCYTSATAMCNVQQWSILVVIAISADNQWVQLHGSNTWIPRSWVQ
jgi:hypothetical protein